MTDREKLIALLTEFGVGFTEGEGSIFCESGSSKVEGYIGFYTSFQFDSTGNFIGMGAYE